MTVVVLPPAVALPPGDWIPNVDQLTDSAAGLLALVGTALDSYGIGGQFERRVWSHGDLIPLQLPETPIGQLLVSFGALELGNAGEKMFRFQKGDIGAHAHAVGEFKVQLWIPWPTPSGGLNAYLADDEDLMSSAADLNQAAWVAFFVLRALSLDGARVTPPVTPIVQDQIIVGPMQPVGPVGGMAGMSIEVQLSYS